MASSRLCVLLTLIFHPSAVYAVRDQPKAAARMPRTPMAAARPPPNTVAEADGSSSRAWLDSKSKRGRSTRGSSVEYTQELPVLWFQDSDARPWLGSIHAGLKRHEARFSDHPVVQLLRVGDSFIARSSRRTIELRVTEVDRSFTSFGPAWSAYGDSLVPPEVLHVGDADAAEAAYATFYPGRTIEPRPNQVTVLGVEVVRTISGAAPKFRAARDKRRVSPDPDGWQAAPSS